jgi:CheY-like chemotaxis protein
MDVGGRYLNTEILIVDDNEVVRSMMTKILGASGYKVTAVGDGQEAVDELSCRQPDLVLSDIQMPRLDGCQVCRWMKSREETRNIPIVLVSGLADTSDRARSAGADGFLMKPFLLDDLYGQIHSLLGA